MQLRVEELRLQEFQMPSRRYGWLVPGGGMKLMNFVRRWKIIKALGCMPIYTGPKVISIMLVIGIPRQKNPSLKVSPSWGRNGWKWQMSCLLRSSSLGADHLLTPRLWFQHFGESFPDIDGFFNELFSITITYFPVFFSASLFFLEMFKVAAQGGSIAFTGRLAIDRIEV